MSLYFSWEADFLLWLQEYVRNDFLNPFMKFITSLGNAGIFWILLTIALLAVPKTRKAGLASAIALVLSLIINNITLKNLIARVRPYDLIEGLTILVKKPLETSFPSGHSAAGMASSWALLRTLPEKWGIPAILLALLIAFSRLYVGVHFPTDVLAGLLTGLAAGELGVRLTPRLYGWWKKRKGRAA